MLGNWREALDTFLVEWKENVDIIGAMVCGSLTKYVLRKMGGFNIDGWKVRSLVIND